MTAVLEPVRTPTLEELAETANNEHLLALEAANATLGHALAAGDALLAAQAQMPPGEWTEWLDSKWQYARETAYCYMRLAHYRDELPHGATGINEAMKALSGRAQRISRRAPEELRDQAKSLRNDGLSLAEIGRILGVSQSSVSHWVDPALARAARDREHARRRQRQAEQAALRRERTESRIHAHGQGIDEAYSRIRKTAQALDAAIVSATDPAIRKALRQSLTHVYAAEDEIRKAFGEERAAWQRAYNRQGAAGR